jgi:hypothetical protein
MTMWLRLLLVLGGGITALCLARDSASFDVAAGMISMLVLVVALVLFAFSRRQ